MNSRATRTPTPTGFVETGTVTFEGREFTSGGAMVSDTYLICYPKDPTFEWRPDPGWHEAPPVCVGDVTTWDGQRIGRYHVTGKARGFASHEAPYGTQLVCYRVRLDNGREYVGRGLGAGCILKCRRAATKKGTGR